MEEIVCVIEDESRGFKGPSAVPLAGPIIVPKKGGYAQYDLFFTNRRIIAAVIFSHRTDVSDLMFGPTAGVQMALKWRKVRKERREQFKGKNADEILHLHPDSFEIPYENIESIKLSKGLLSANMEIKAVWKGEIRRIKLPIPKKKFDEVKKIVNRYLSDKVI